jgi:hypothetical protein
MRAGKRKKAKRVAVALVALDLMVTVVVLAHSGLAQVAGKTVSAMSSRHLEQILEKTARPKDDQNRSAFVYTCTVDPNGGWDYYCTGSDGARGLYDVSARKITAASIIQR